MKLVSLLNKKLIRFNCDVANREELIKRLADLLIREVNNTLKIADVLKAIHEREELAETSFEEGIAIPHARLDNFNDTVIAIGVPKNPLEDSGKVIRMVVLILTSKTSSKTYLQTLATFARISLDTELFANLVACKNAGSEDQCVDRFLDLLAPVKIKTELTAGDIMSSEVRSVTPECSIHDLTTLMYKHHISYVPVIDENGDFIAEVNTNDVIRSGIPNYAIMIGNLKFLSSFEPFEELLAKEDVIQVKSIMRKPSIKLSPETSIIETALELAQNNRRHVPIVDGKKILGIVSFMDILKKVIRG